MVLSASDLARFERHGFLVRPALFTPAEAAVLRRDVFLLEPRREPGP